MADSESAREDFERALRDHIKSVLKNGVSRREMCRVLGVTRQAISSYVIGRTTPKPHLVRKLLTAWPKRLEIKDVTFGPEAFGAAPVPKLESVPYQGDLFSALSSAKTQDIRMDVAKEAETGDLELRFSVRIAR